MASNNYRIQIQMNAQGQDWSLNLTSNEEAIINMLLSFYGVFEGKIRELARASNVRNKAPEGMIDDALVLLRCLVMRRLEEHAGKFVKIERFI